MYLSKIETELAYSKHLGSIVEIEEKPIEKYSIIRLLTVAILAFLFTATFVGFPAFAILGGIVSSLELWFPNVYKNVYKIITSVISIASPYPIMALFGAFGALGVFYWYYYWYSKQPYDSKVIILSNGFIYHKPTDKKDRFAYRYDEVSSISLRLPSYSGPVSSGCHIYYRYHVNNKEKYVISSMSLTLARYVGNYIFSKHWVRLKDLLENGNEICFGDICVSKKYIKIRGSADSFKLEGIKEIKLYISSEDEVFQLEFKPGFRSKWAGGVYVPCEEVSNPHLFFKALEFVGIPLNLSVLPELENHLKLLVNEV
ncbi:MAG: hypothetical protein SNJ50_04205 [Cyanobacteriota bacterium]